MAPDRRLLLEAAAAVAALTAAGLPEPLLAEARRLAGLGVAPADLREAAYLASLFCGFPKGVAALVALAELEGAPAFHSDPPPPGRREAVERGRALFREVHRRNAGRQLQMLERIHPDFAETVLAEAYGRVLARPFLPLAAREVVGVAALTVLGLLPQLRAHLLGAHNAGASWDEVAAAIAKAGLLTGTDVGPAAAMAAELGQRPGNDTRAV